MTDEQIYKHACYIQWLRWKVETEQIGGPTDGDNDPDCQKYLNGEN